jgi:hypothetical protein
LQQITVSTNPAVNTNDQIVVLVCGRSLLVISDAAA